MSDVQKKKVVEKRYRRERAHQRLRQRVAGTAERPRLAVYKSERFVYAQVIDDERGHTLVSAASIEPEIKGKLASVGANKVAAKAVGEAVAERAMAKGITRVVFDRGGYRYHGKVKELAEAARAKGLEF
ncbi:MAG: 50S ribosomal protein L18 [Thermoanaerobaculia bacterium]|nr:MAG: 50S ribosomal protein L18 [Thermoanaerobaculia bacterium]MBZ0101331.1 50S ribosomal protein L18 [Thermoanaerobaculia bacterium]